MFVLFLKFSDNKSKASEFMEEHNAWIQGGIQRGNFLVVGSLQVNQGGAILIHGLSKQEVEQCVLEDPFVEHGVVKPEIFEIAPTLTDERLNFLRG